MNVVSMEEFARECHDKLTILYIHGKHPDWDIRQRIYMEGIFLIRKLLRSFIPFLSAFV